LVDDLTHTIARLRAAWMAGGAAIKHCPPEWLPAIGEGPPAELALAALAGQALQSVFRPAPGGPLLPRETLPALSLPPVPDAFRPRVRRLIAAHPWMLKHLLIFLAARGVTMHPADWLPAKRSDELPALYAPWTLWVNGGAAPQKPAAKSPVLDSPALAAELAQMLEIGTVGLLHRRKRLKIQQLKTAPQNARRQVLFTQVPLTALATALGVAAADLVQTAPTGAEAGIQAFAAMVAASGRAEEQRALLTAMLDDPECPLAGARPLVAALDQRQAASLLPKVLRREAAPQFKLALDLAGEALGLATLPHITAAPGYKILHEHLTAAELERPAQAALTAGLAALGLLATAQTAQNLIDICIHAGLLPADLKLDALQLNAALIPENSV
jgi:hypothetical protein